MILRKKFIPLDAREEVMGFRGQLGVRKCFFCGTDDDTNFDKNGLLQMIRVNSIDKNFFNTRASNHIFVCVRPDCIQSRPRQF